MDLRNSTTQAVRSKELTSIIVSEEEGVTKSIYCLVAVVELSVRRVLLRVFIDEML